MSEADVYQVLAYAHRYETDLAVLVFTHRGALGAAGVQKEFLIRGGGAATPFASECLLWTSRDLGSVAEQLEQGLLPGRRETVVG